MIELAYLAQWISLDLAYLARGISSIALRLHSWGVRKELAYWSKLSPDD